MISSSKAFLILSREYDTETTITGIALYSGFLRSNSKNCSPPIPGKSISSHIKSGFVDSNIILASSAQLAANTLNPSFCNLNKIARCSAASSSTTKIVLSVLINKYQGERVNAPALDSTPANGTVKKKVLPFPSSDSNQTSPSHPSTSDLTRLKPSPLPSGTKETALLAR